MNTMNQEMAKTLCEAICAKRTPVAVFSDANPAGFRVRTLIKTSDKDLYLSDFVMVADKHIKPDELMTEWNYKVAMTEANA